VAAAIATRRSSCEKAHDAGGRHNVGGVSARIVIVQMTITFGAMISTKSGSLTLLVVS
jgi:hypothetical protein